MKIKHFALLGTTIALMLYLFLALSVSNKVNNDDFIEIHKLNIKHDCNRINDFDTEINCIKSIQNKIINIIEVTEFEATSNSCNVGMSAEPKTFILNKRGCCVQYSRFIEKTLRYYGFKTRHVFLIQPYNKISLSNILSLNQQSHAATEVLTSYGWMGVDSMTPTILYNTKNNNVNSFKDLANDSKLRLFYLNSENEVLMNFISKEVDTIYGLYSRHGMFYGLNLPGPEFNLKELIYNFI